MIKIYHNPRCRKSREGLALLENSGKEFEVVKYLEDLLSTEELKEIIQKLDIEPMSLVRKTEAIWKEKYKNKNLTNEAIVHAMIENPKLIERPIVIRDSKGVIGRPASNITTLIN